jgi:hypothetical protein
MQQQYQMQQHQQQRHQPQQQPQPQRPQPTALRSLSAVLNATQAEIGSAATTGGLDTRRPGHGHAEVQAQRAEGQFLHSELERAFLSASEGDTSASLADIPADMTLARPGPGGNMASAVVANEPSRSRVLHDETPRINGRGPPPVTPPRLDDGREPGSEMNAVPNRRRPPSPPPIPPIVRLASIPRETLFQILVQQGKSPRELWYLLDLPAACTKADGTLLFYNPRIRHEMPEGPFDLGYVADLRGVWWKTSDTNDGESDRAKRC